ncbi:hypothetical protein [Vibrio cholerae]
MDIEEAYGLIERKEKVLVRYFGGKSPGAKRMIAPIALVDDTKIRARCYSSNRVKEFFVSKLVIANESDDGLDSLYLDPQQAAEFSTLEEVSAFYKDTLESLGWGVEVGAEFRVFGFFKNGRMRRTPSASISFLIELGEELITDPNLVLVSELATNKRPWCVRAKGKKTTNFRELNKAAQKFMEYVIDLDSTGK